MDGFDSETGEIIMMHPSAIAEAIVAVMAEVRMLGVDEKNPHGGYPYVSVDKFYDIIGRKMASHGLALIMDETSTDVREGSSGKPWLFARYSMAFLHKSGVMSAPVRRSIALPISGPQTFGAAQSYIEKQFLRQVFKVPTGEKDADETDNSEKAPQPPTRRPQTAQQTSEPPQGHTHTNSNGEAVVYDEKGKPHRAPPSPDRAEVSKRYTQFRDAVKAATLGDELDAIFASQDWQDLQAELIAIGEGKRIDGLIKLRNEKMGNLNA